MRRDAVWVRVGRSVSAKRKPKRGQRETDLKAEGEEGEDRWVTRLVQGGDGRVETLCETRQQIERDDEERLVGLLDLRWVGAVVLEVDERLLYDGDAALEHRLRVIDEALTDGDDDRGEALRERGRGSDSALVSPPHSPLTSSSGIKSGS